MAFAVDPCVAHTVPCGYKKEGGLLVGMASFLIFCVKNEGKDTWPSILGYFFMGVVTLKQKEKMTKGKSVKYKNNYEHLLILAIR